MKNLKVFVIAVVAVLVIGLNALVVTYPNEYSAIYQFGKVVSVKSQPGPSFKIPFVQTVKSIPKQKLIYDLPVSDVITLDKKTMIADSFALWYIEDPLKYVQGLSGGEVGAESRINASVYNAMKNVIGRTTQADMISGRDSLSTEIYKNLGTSLSQYGIKIASVETKHLDLPADNRDAVYKRMISERDNIAASYLAQGEADAKVIRTETDRDITILLSEAQAEADKLVAEGEAEYMRILSEAYNNASRAEFYEFVRALDAAKLALASRDKTLFLDKSSPIAQVFYP